MSYLIRPIAGTYRAENLLVTNTENYLLRYEIAANPPAWAEAEKQVRRLTTSKTNDGDKTVTVSVKSSKQNPSKRKGETIEEVYMEEIGDKEVKKLKKGMKRSKDRS